MNTGKFTLINDAQLAPSVRQCLDEYAADVTQIDLRAIQQAGAAIDLLAQRAAFPDYFGGNLDALYDIASERAGAQNTHQVWLIRSTHAQEKMLFPMLDTLRDALSESKTDALTILWWING